MSPPLAIRIGDVRRSLELVGTGRLSRRDLDTLCAAHTTLAELVNAVADELTVQALEPECPFCGDTGVVERSVGMHGPHRPWVTEPCAACSSRAVVARALAQPRPLDPVVDGWLDTVREVQEDLDRSEDSAPDRVVVPRSNSWQGGGEAA